MVCKIFVQQCFKVDMIQEDQAGERLDSYFWQKNMKNSIVIIDKMVK